MNRTIAFYSKSFDAGQGIHWIETDATGIILDEWDAPRPGSNHYYENQTKKHIGKNIKDLRGSGFRKARLTDEDYIAFIESRT